MNIHTMCDDEVESRLKYLTGRERELLHLILDHIREVESRKLHLRRGHSTMFEYLTKELNYSAAAAMRRLGAARILRIVPEVAEQIQSGEVNLSQLSELSRAIREKEKVGEVVEPAQTANLLQSIAGKNTFETQKEIAKGLEMKLKKPEQIRIQRDDSVHISLTFSKDQHSTVMRAKDKAAHLLSEKQNDHSLSSFIEILAKSYLGRKLRILQDETQSNQFRVTESVSGDLYTAKTISPRLRRFVIERDRCCQYVDAKSGNKCESTYGLEVDHRQPRWAGGTNSIDNLQVLCSAHNKFKYQLESGRLKEHTQNH
ncbi:HNH endonuclease [Bdellovibrio sp. HCB274]|uniref:HNH endonuclease n=1 Tax=Bdellovibrio sp. HCB274 TaxID=3394361 RepID=UPI0039B6DF53